MRELPSASWHPELAPSWNLLNDWKDGITWEEYTRRFRAEILSRPNAVESMRFLASAERRITLVCFEKSPPCHRFLLLEWLPEFEPEMD